MSSDRLIQQGVKRFGLARDRDGGAHEREGGLFSESLSITM